MTGGVFYYGFVFFNTEAGPLHASLPPRDIIHCMCVCVCVCVCEGGEQEKGELELC